MSELNWKSKEAVELTNRLVHAQNAPQNRGRDIVSFSRFSESLAELEHYVLQQEYQLVLMMSK